MNLTTFSPPCSHFGITIFEQEEEKRGIALYQTWHIVNSITLHHIILCHIIWYHILSYIPNCITSYPILSYPIVSYPIQSYHIISHHIKPQHIKSTVIKYGEPEFRHRIGKEQKAHHSFDLFDAAATRRNARAPTAAMLLARSSQPDQ